MKRQALPQTIETLVAHYGPPERPPAASPMEMILWENVAYLADDDRRAKAFRLLKEKTSLEPERILAASDDDLLEVARYGIVPDQTVAKLRKIAQISLTSFPDGLEAALKLPVKQAVKALKRFPAIGEPGAERILMLMGGYPVFGLESNSLRVLQRLGFGSDTGRFDADYKAAQSQAQQELPADSSVLASAYLALRRHGHTVCRRTSPLCHVCPLRPNCPSTGVAQPAF